MPTLVNLLQTPEAYNLEEVLQQNADFIKQLINYISTPPQPLLHNERQCYYYPLKSLEILNGPGIYRLIIAKQLDTTNVTNLGNKKKTDQQKKQEEIYRYPFLELLFKNLKNCYTQDLLLGYIDKFLYCLTKKTPQIYEYVKDNQKSFAVLLCNDKILEGLKQFLTLFLTESTMLLYVFLKNMVIRTLMFRIVQDEDTRPVVYEVLCIFYEQLQKTYKDLTSQQDKEEIIQVLKNIQQQNFIALLSLKMSIQSPRKTFFIAKMLYQITLSPNQCAELLLPFVETFSECLQAYEQSSDFMLLIMPDQILILRLLLQIVNQLPKQTAQLKQHLLKRLLVYSNVHYRNTILHNMLFALVQLLYRQGELQMLIQGNLISFLKSNTTDSKFGYMSLRRRIARFWIQKQLDKLLLDQQEKRFVQEVFDEQKIKLQSSKFFKPEFNNSGNILQTQSSQKSIPQSNTLKEIQKSELQESQQKKSTEQGTNQSKSIQKLEEGQKTSNK